MTGYGDSEVVTEGFRIRVEIRSVNHRYLDISIRGPNFIGPIENEVRERIGEKLSRGRISVNVDLRFEGGATPNVSANMSLVKRYVDLVTQIQTRYDVKGKMDVSMLTALPGVFEQTDPTIETETIRKAIEQPLEEAIRSLVAMRTEEGEKLKADSAARVGKLEGLIGEIENAAPVETDTACKKLKDRVEKALAGTEFPDKERLSAELALMAEKMDFTEECVRAKAHITSFTSLLEKDEAVGRRLDFLLQELIREVNTIGAKANSAAISGLVVSAKEEIERLREQAQNIE
jgi:uncharacterized protein (TIGR00255 family)